jgi:hypothetical protein
MQVLEPVERYFNAWNSHDGGAIAACFDIGGGYTDPVSGQLPPPSISPYASGLFSAFPDLRFELHVTAVDEPYVVAQWTMTGIQSGPSTGCRRRKRVSSCPGSMSLPWVRQDCAWWRAISTSEPSSSSSAYRSPFSPPTSGPWRLAHPCGSGHPTPASQAPSA